ncbi:MAG: hypothetical protein NC127_01090 [Muribaculum sp.]|nr:hypothetical protein [Muribaculum sp.]
MQRGILWITGLEKYQSQCPDIFYDLLTRAESEFNCRGVKTEQIRQSLLITHPKTGEKVLIFFFGSIDNYSIQRILDCEVNNVIFLHRPANMSKQALISIAMQNGIPFVTQPLTQFDFLPGLDAEDQQSESILNFTTNNNKTGDSVNIYGDNNGTINIYQGEKPSKGKVYVERLWSFLIGVLVNISTGNCTLFNLF